MPNFFVVVRQDVFHAYGWPSWLVRPVWRVKRVPKRAYPPFWLFSCAIAHHFLGDPDSNVKNAKFFRGRPSRPCLCIRLAITACPTLLEGQTSPKASIPLISTIFVCYSKLFFGWSEFQRQNCQIFFVDVRQDLVYASGLPLWTFRPILKVKRAPKRATPHFEYFRVL